MEYKAREQKTVNQSTAKGNLRRRSSVLWSSAVYGERSTLREADWLMERNVQPNTMRENKDLLISATPMDNLHHYSTVFWHSAAAWPCTASALPWERLNG